LTHIIFQLDAAALRPDCFYDEPIKSSGVSMMQSWTSLRRTNILLVITLMALDRAGAQMFGWDLLPALGVGAGLLLLWGIGHCDTKRRTPISWGPKTGGSRAH